MVEMADKDKLLGCLKSVQNEIGKVKESIPQMINSEVLQAFRHYPATQRELVSLKEEHRKMTTELKRWKNKYETAQNELNAQKQMHREAMGKISCLKDQLALEVQFCAKLGSSSCNLLWSLSKHGIPHSTLNTTCMNKLLETIEQTLINYSQADSGLDPGSDEVKLVESLCGTITNISATDEGREFLLENDCGKQLTGTVISILTSFKDSPSLLKLLLMFLFNVGIHNHGQVLLQKQIDVKAVEEIIYKTRSFAVILGCLKLLWSVFEDFQGENFGLSFETVSFCISHQNKDVRDFATKYLNGSGMAREH